MKEQSMNKWRGMNELGGMNGGEGERNDLAESVAKFV